MTRLTKQQQDAAAQLQWITMFSDTDFTYMQRALELAVLGLYTTAPNPRVGCVLVKDGQVIGITLLHAGFAGLLSPEEAKSVLQAYQGRYTALVDAVTEAQPDFDDLVLGQVPMIELLTQPVAVLARHWSA